MQPPPPLPNSVAISSFPSLRRSPKNSPLPPLSSKPKSIPSCLEIAQVIVFFKKKILTIVKKRNENSPLNCKT